MSQAQPAHQSEAEAISQRTGTYLDICSLTTCLLFALSGLLNMHVVHDFTSNILILFVDDMLNVTAVLLNLVCHQYPADDLVESS
jgi:hypothetical protein